MAYKTRYILRFDSEKYNHDYRILIKEKDYTGEAEDKALGAAPVLRRDDSDSGISGTSLELVIQADIDSELTSLYTVDNKKFLVELYRNDVLVWCGYVLPEKYSEPYISVPYDVSVTASDGLGILKDIPFALTGERTLFDVIKYCCDQTSLPLDFEIISSLRETSMSESNVMHVQSILESSIFSGKTCYEVLESCMTSLDSFVTQHENKWFVVKYTDLDKKSLIYSNAGTKKGERLLDVGTLGAIGDNFYPVGNLEKDILPAYKSTKLSYDYGKKSSFLSNYDFSSELNNWEYTTLQSPTRVKHFTHDGMGFVRILGRSANGGTAEEPNYIRQTIDVEKTNSSSTFIISHAMGKGFAEGNGEFNVHIKLACGSKTHYLTKSGWRTTSEDIVVSSAYQSQHLGDGDMSWVDSYTEFKILANGFPDSGKLTIQISNPVVTTQYRLYINKVVVTNDVTTGIDVDVNLNTNASTSYASMDIAFGDTPIVANAKKLFNGILWGNGGFTRTWTNGNKTDSYLYTILKCVCSRIGFPRQQLSGIIQGENLQTFMLTRDKYSNLLFHVKEASLNLLTDEMDCTLEQFMPYSELSGETSESARATGNSSEYRSSGDNEVRVYQSGSGVPMRIKDLSPTELQPDSVIEVDRNNAQKSGKATLQKLLEFILSTGDVWTEEELQVVGGYILYLGDKIKAGDSDLWSGHHFSDYLNQFLLTTSDVEFKSVLTKILTTNEITTPDFVSGLLGSGARLKDNHLELDEITVRKRMNVFQLVIQKVMHQGGILILSPGGTEITSVVDGGTYYKCTFDTKNGKLKQPFVVDDQLLCQSFDEGNTRRYWRRITSVGEDYFNLSKTDCEENSAIPTVGDEVVVLGNRTDVSRQNALILQAVGDDAPYMDTYDDINSFSLDGKLCTREGNLSGIVDEVFGQLGGTGLYAKRVYLRGKFALDTGDEIGEKLDNLEDNLVTVSGRQDTQEGNITEIRTKVEALPGQITQEVSGVIDWTKKEINTAIAETITSIVEEYYLSNSATSLIGGSWVSTSPAWVDGKFTWKRSLITYADNTITTTSPVCVTGATGATGAAGKGVKSTVVTYQASTSGTTVPTGTWGSSIPSVAANSYLWTRTIITYTDNATSTSYAIGKMGATGATGATGKGVKSTAVTYQSSTSGTMIPAGTWGSTIPSVAANSYLWTRTIITYTDNTTSTSYSIGKMGATGATGSKGDTGAQGIPGESLHGKMLNRDPEFRKGNNGVSMYNNTSGGNVTVTRIARPSDCPTTSGYCLKIKTAGAASPGCGGFVLSIQSRANAVFIQKIIAKIPVGYTITNASNSMGTGYTDTWLTSRAGTGKYETYLRKVVCGATGSFSSGGHVYLSGSPTPTASAPLEWYLAYCTVFDQTQDEGIDNLLAIAKSELVTGINQNTLGITLYAKQTDFNALGTRVSTTEATIKTQASNIELKVSKNGVVAAINASPETVKISAAKIDLVGKVTFSMLDTNAQSTVNGKITSVQATTIATTQVNTLKNSLGSLAYLSKVEQAQLGTTVIQGGHIKTDLIDVDSIFARNIVFSGSLTSNDYNTTVSGSGTSAVVTTVGSRYSKSGFVVSSGGGTGILPPSSGVTQVAKIEAIGNQALIVGLEIVVKDTYSSAYLHEQNALIVEARTVYSSPQTRPRSIYSRAGDVIIENGNVRIVNGGFGGMVRSFSLSGASATIDSNFLTGSINSATSGMVVKIKPGFEGQRLALLNYSGVSFSIYRNDRNSLSTKIPSESSALLYYTDKTWLPVQVGNLYYT